MHSFIHSLFEAGCVSGPAPGIGAPVSAFEELCWEDWQEHLLWTTLGFLMCRSCCRPHFLGSPGPGRSAGSWQLQNLGTVEPGSTSQTCALAAEPVCTARKQGEPGALSAQSGGAACFLELGNRRCLRGLFGQGGFVLQFEEEGRLAR